VQRVCKYPILLTELVKRTNATHADYKDLLKARKVVDNMVMRVNERTKDIENQKKIADIVSRVTGIEKCNPDRYMFDGPLTDLSSLKKKGEQSVHFYLFSNCLVRTKQSKGRLKIKQWKVKEFIPAEMMVVSEADPSLSSKHKHLIEITHTGIFLFLPFPVLSLRFFLFSLCVCFFFH